MTIKLWTVSLLISSLCVAFGITAVAAPAALTYQGRIVKSDGLPLEASSVSFQFELVGPSGTCVLYREQVNGLDMRNSNGMFDIKIGASHSYPALPSKTLFDSLDNSKPLTCEGGVVYNPLPQDGRILRVQFFDGGAWKLITPDAVIRSVPYAGFSSSSAKLQGHEATEFILKTEVNGNTSCDSGSFLTWNAGTQAFGCATPPSGGGGGSGTVTGVSSANSYITISNASTTPQITLNVGTIANTVAAGNDPRIVNALQSGGVAGGDLAGTYPNPSVAKIANTDLSFTALLSGQVLKYNGSAWVNAALSTSDISGLSSYMTQSAFSAAVTPAASCSTSQTMYWSSVTGAFACQNISLAFSDLSGNLPLAKIPQGGAGSGQVLKWNGTAWAPANDDAGSGGAGTVTSVSGTGAIAVATGTTTPVISVSTGGITSTHILDGTILNADIAGLDMSKVSGELPLAQIAQAGATTGQVLKWDGTAWAVGNDETATAGGSGTVTSVTGTGAVSVANGTTTPVISVATANTTTSGVLSAADWNSFNSKLGTALNSGQVFVGNVSNVAAARTLKISDIKSTISGNWFLPTGACPSGQVLSYDSSSDSISCQAYTLTSAQVTGALGFSPASFPSQTGHGGKILQTDGTAVSWVDAPAGGGGSVTSVSGSGPVSVATGTTTPVISVATANTTTAGVLSAADWNSFNSKLGTALSSGQVFVGNASSVAAARTLKISDIKSTIAGSWFLPTGACPSGQVLSYDSSSDSISCQAYTLTSAQVTGALGYSPASFPSQSGQGGKFLQTNGTAVSWVDAPAGGGGGSVTSVSGSGPISVATGTTTPAISIATANTTTAGALSAADWNSFNGKLGTGLNSGLVWVGNGSNLAAARTLKITDIKSTVSGNWFLPSGGCASGQTLTYTSASDTLSCQAYSVTSSQVTGALGFTPISSAVTTVTAGTGLTGGTITSTGTIGLGAELAGINSLTTTGFVKRTGAGAYTTAAINLAADVSGVLPISAGGTGANSAAAAIAALLPSQTGQSGKILQTNGTALSWVDTPTAGSNGTVTSVSGSGPISVATGTTTPVISIATANTTTSGVLSSTDWNSFNNKLGTSLASGQVLVGNGSNIAAARTLKITDIKSTVSGNFFLPTGACPSGQTLTYTSASDTLSCQAYSLTSSQVTGALGYTPLTTAVTSVATGSGLTGGTITGTGTISVASGGITSAHIADGTIVDADIGGVGASKISGTLSSRLGLSQSGFHVATKDDITTRTDSGFYQTSTATTGEGWPATTNGWYHLISNTHSNDGNYYSMQFAGNFDNSNEIYYRSTGGNGAAGWSRLWHSGNLTNLNQLSNGPGYLTGINSTQVTNALGYTPLPQNSGSGLTIGNNGAGGPQVMGVGNGASMISFHRPGQFGVNFGLDTDNVLKVGGWSMGNAVAHTIWHSGNFNPGSKVNLDAWSGSSYIGSDGRHFGTQFIDSNDHGFYVDPNGSSRMVSVVTTSGWDGTQGGLFMQGNAPSITMQDTDSNIRWMFHNQDDSLRIYRANTAGGADWDQKIIFANDGNIWSKNIGDWIFNRIGQDVRSGANPNFGNIWLGYTGTWLSDRLNQDVRTGSSPSFDYPYLNGIRRPDNGGQMVLRGGVDDNGGGSILLGGTGSGISGKVYLQSRGPSGTAADIIFRRYDGTSQTNLGYFSGNGNLRVEGTVTQASDIRLKTNLVYLSPEEALEKIGSLNAIFYDWKDQKRRGTEHQLGLIAQEVQKIYPEAVKADDEGFLSVSYANLVAPVIEAIKALTHRSDIQSREIASVKEENARLNSENDELKKRVEMLEADAKLIKEKLGIK